MNVQKVLGRNHILAPGPWLVQGESPCCPCGVGAYDGDAQENEEINAMNIVKISLVKGPTSAYIRAQIRGKILLDSGSHSSILSEKLIRAK